ncbi:hypothetical protein [Flexithrix dorotheae]|uniref:hypothetical protein n=1 Tax=Flexithrix dorotheae TaxID=70993 RepID=UPI00037D0F42|nr:hypothetical protein [Flexithrix dorotheae]
MKVLFLLISLPFLFCSVHAQDIITTRNKDELKVKIIEQSEREIKYKKEGYEDGPLITIKTRRVKEVKYQDGTVDLVGNQNPRWNKPFGVHLGIASNLDEAYINLSMDYFIIPQVSIEGNISMEFEYQNSISFGSKFHLNSKYSNKKFTPFTGVLIGENSYSKFLQLPLGVNFINTKGLNVVGSISHLAYINSFESYYSGSDVLLEFKAGWRF